MEHIEIKLHSKEPHVSQILTGFCMLETSNKRQYRTCISAEVEGLKGAFVEVTYKGKKIIYDVMDGYQDVNTISKLLNQCDFYFKRSYSAEKNEKFHLAHTDKMYPLGFNYHVSCKKHPLDKPVWKEMIKKMLCMEHNTYSNTSFSVKMFEEIPVYRKDGFTVLFATRLWEPEKELPEYLNEERQYINQMRINIIRNIREIDGVNFVGGVSNNSFSREFAPDLIIPEKMTNRQSYIKILHKADVCIGTMGLHESIGWKTGEYVAAAKAIVNETLHYTLPGDFIPGKNYLEFENEEQCITAVRTLLADPVRLFEMKKANRAYYCTYLRPDRLIKNSLDIVDKSMRKC